MEKINLAEFNIDVDSLIRETQNVKQRIDEIRSEMKEMTKENKTSSEAFINNAVSLRELNSEYRNQLKVLGETAAAKGKIVPLEQQVDGIMQRQTKTINDLRKQNTDLLKTRNNLNLENAEHVKLLDEINKKYDENTQQIKANVSQREQEQMSVGGYSAAIKEALNETQLFTGATGDLNRVVSVTSTVVNQTNTEMKAYWQSMLAAETGSKRFAAGLKLLRVAIIATGVGALLVLLGSLVAYISSSEQASNKFTRVLKTLGGVVQGLLRYLLPLGEFLLNTLVKGFEMAGKAATRFMNFLSSALDSLGFEKAAQGLRNFTNELSESARQAQALADAEAALEESQRRANSTQLKYQKEAEKLRQIRDDESISIRERIEANDRLGEALRNQIEAEKEIAVQALYVANMRIAAYGRTKEALDAQAEAMERIIDIEERITGQQSEQLTNRVSLQKEAADRSKEIREKAQDDALKQQSDALDLFIAEQGIRAKTLEQELEDERNIADRKKKILEDELEFKKISQEKYNAEILKINNDLLRRQAEIAENNALRELKAHEDRVQIEREANKWLTDERLTGLEDQEIALRERRAALEALRFSEGLINEQEYADNVLAIHREHEQNLKALRDERKAAKAEERELDYEAEMLALQQRNADQFEIESLMIEQQRERALEAARQKYTDEALLAQAILNIEAEASIAKQQIEDAKNQSIFQSRADLAGAIANLVGQETLLGKAAAIAQATMNTYQGATKALASLPPPASYIAAAATIAQGLSSVAKITGISSGAGGFSAPEAPQSPQQILAPVLEAVPPFAGGGKVTGGIPINRSNGDNVLATLKVGEVVLNRSQQRALGGDSTFRAIGVPGFANGGVVSAPVVQSMIRNQVDEVFVEAISRAVRLGAQSGTASGAQKGITDLSTERHIQNLSSF